MTMTLYWVSNMLCAIMLTCLHFRFFSYKYQRVQTFDFGIRFELTISKRFHNGIEIFLETNNIVMNIILVINIIH